MQSGVQRRPSRRGERARQVRGNHRTGSGESGGAGLEDALALWQRGEELHRYCVGKLDAAQGAIEELGARLATKTSS